MANSAHPAGITLASYYEGEEHDLAVTAIAAAWRRAKGGEGKRKSPDQGAVVTMATASAPAPLKLGEDVGLLPPSVPPYLHCHLSP